MNELKRILKTNVRQYTMLLVLVVMTLFFQIMSKGILLVPQNFSNLVLQNAYVVILAVGMMICIITGGNIDLSVGSVVAFIGALCGVLIIENDYPVYPVIGFCLLVSIGIGFWHGFWIAKFEISSFIATLSGMLIFRGLTFALLGGKTYTRYPREFLRLTTGFLHDYLGSPDLKINVTTICLGIVASLVYAVWEYRKRLEKKRYGFEALSPHFFLLKTVLIVIVINAFMITFARYKGMPIVLIPVAVIVLVYSYILNNSVIGRHLYAIGGNQKAAKLSGIKIERTMLLTYVNMAFLAAIAGLVFTARLNSASPQAGQSFELDAIAACYIGGASASGGVGTITGALIGALVMGILNNGMSIMSVDMNWQMVIKGLVLLAAVVLDMVQRNRRKG